MVTAFSNLSSVWARTVSEEAASLAHGGDPPTSPLAFLLDQSSAVDDVCHGTLATLMLDLYECSAWGAAPQDWASLMDRRTALLRGAEAALLSAKTHHLPSVAASCGVGEEYCASILAGAGRSDRGAAASLAGAAFGLSVVVVDLQRDLVFLRASPDPTTPALHAALTRAVTDARAIVSASVKGSAGLWARLAAAAAAEADAAAKSGGRPFACPRTPPRRAADPRSPLGGEDVVTLYEKAMARVTIRLEQVASTIDGGDAALAAVLRARAPSPPSAPATPVATPRVGWRGSGGVNFDDLLAGLNVAATEKGRTWAHEEAEQ